MHHPARSHADQLMEQMERANQRLRQRLDGMTDEEYLWEPVAGCWTVRRRETATSQRPQGRGEWVFDNGDVDASPAPFTTIAWRLMHLTDVLASYHVALWGGELSDDLFDVPPTAAAGVMVWDDFAGAFVEALRGEDDDTLRQPVRVPWWPEDAPRWRVVQNVATEAIHHGAEIGVLRDLYARKDELQR